MASAKAAAAVVVVGGYLSPPMELIGLHVRSGKVAPTAVCLPACLLPRRLQRDAARSVAATHNQYWLATRFMIFNPFHHRAQLVRCQKEEEAAAAAAATRS